MRTMFRLITLSVILMLLFSSFSLPAQADPIEPPPPGGDSTGPDGTPPAGADLELAYHAGTGKVRFMRPSSNLSIPQPSALAPDATPEMAALNFLAGYGELFGLQDPASELTVMKTSSLPAEELQTSGRSFVRYQQVYQGIPVMGGELIVQLDALHEVRSVSGEVLPGLALDTQPRVSAEVAIQNAKAAIGKLYELEAETLQATPPELWIYNPVLLGGRGPREDRLTWRMTLTHPERPEIRELVLVDAVLGSIALNFNQVDSAKNRLTYDANNATTLPGTLRCDESNPTCIGGDPHEVAAHTFAGATYDFYMNQHGRDSIDNAGLTLVSTVHYDVGYDNAFWNGSQMIYGDAFGFPLADDVVAHELTHGVTEHESGLYYHMQSGAINEALSDIWGELVDQYQATGNDVGDTRWELGEDISGLGAIRNMADPTLFGDPDRMGSPNYVCSSDTPGGDYGGVHSNSGVANKAAFLMVDGGSFNGQTISALGYQKTAKIWYEVQTRLLTSAADYQDLGSALHQACLNLVGTAGITSGNCTSVQQAVLATEMNNPASCSTAPAPLCTITALNSQFNGSSSGWYAVSGWGAWSTTADYLQTEGGSDEFYTVATYNTHRDFTYEARMRRYGGASSNGMIVRGTPEPLGSGSRWHSGYGFYYTREGQYSVWRYDNGAATAIGGWASSPAILTGDAFNTLKVVANGAYFEFYINGTKVWEGMDATYDRGQVGLTMFRSSGSLGDLFQVDWAVITGGDPLHLYRDGFENPVRSEWIRGYFVGYAGDGFHWYLPNNANPFGFNARNGEGNYNLWGYDMELAADYYMRMDEDVPLPSGKTAYLHFDHFFDFDSDDDGGWLQYSANGGPWLDVSAGMFTHNGYGGTISGTNNPQNGKMAFINDSDGPTSSRVNLGSLAGQNVRFRFRIATDESGWDWGWFVDNVGIYTCEPDVGRIFLPLTPKPGIITTFHTNFNGSMGGWQAHFGAWSEGTEYLTTPGQDNMWSSISYPLDYTNVRVDARFLRNGVNPLYANTIIVRGNPASLTAEKIWNNGYYFNYSNDGRYWIFKIVGGNIAFLQGGTPTPAVLVSDASGDYWNYMTVMAFGSNLYLYINDQLVWSGTDTSLTSGRVGFSMAQPPGWNRLYVDWASVYDYSAAFSLAELGLPETISPEQQALNAAAQFSSSAETGR